MKPPRCTYTTELGWMTPEHVRDCTEVDCRGCKPCGEDHCAMRGRCASHVNHAAGIVTCPGCIGKARKDLTAIVVLYALAAQDVELRGLETNPLLDEAEAGVDSEAFNLVGPAATHEQWSERRNRLIALNERRGWCEWPRHESLADNDPHHPYAVLGRWDLAMRENYGPQTDLFVTVSSSAAYLLNMLGDHPFSHSDEFEDFAREIATCRKHLEQITHDARVPEEGRHCPTCVDLYSKGPRLRKHYAQHPELKAGEHCKKPPRTAQQLTGCTICIGDGDTWHCPDNGEHWWSEYDYRTKVATDYVLYATELTMSDLPQRTGIAAGTLRRWAGRTPLGIVDGVRMYGEPKLKARGRNAEGRKVYRVKDAIALRGVSLDNETLDVSKSG